jgi:hypothetical protein
MSAVLVHIEIEPGNYRRALAEARHNWTAFAELYGWTPTVRHHRKLRVRARRLAVAQRRMHRLARCWRCNPRGNPPKSFVAPITRRGFR